MPQMGAAFMGWQGKVTLIRVTQTITNGLVANTESVVEFQGVIQPLSARQVSLKPEGQRAWQWMMIHAFNTNLNLTDNDKIKLDGVPYKIMGVWPYERNNFIEYHAVRDFTP